MMKSTSISVQAQQVDNTVSTTKSNPSQARGIAFVESNPGLSVKATLLERGISSGAIANFMRTPDRQ
jgi:hypothetical protein